MFITSSLKTLCLNVLLDKHTIDPNSVCPSDLSDDFAKLILGTGNVDICHLKLCTHLTTLHVKFPLMHEVVHTIFSNFRTSLETLTISHADFSTTTFAVEPFSKLHTLKIINPRNLNQQQVDSLCKLLPSEMTVFALENCSEITFTSCRLIKQTERSFTNIEKPDNTCLSVDM